MEQVRKEAEQNESLKRDLDSVGKTSEKLKDRSSKQQEKLNELADSMKTAASKTSEYFTQFKEQASQAAEKTSEKVNSAGSENETVKKAKEFMKATYEDAPPVFKHVKGTFSSVMDKAQSTLSSISGEEKSTKHKEWKQWRDSAAAQEEDLERRKKEFEARKAEAEARGESTADEDFGPGNAVVVSKAANSSWDRFGAGLGDMPLLSSVFDSMFGESEIAASIREMKEIDPSFQLADFQEEMEEVVAPHVVKMYLEGDQKNLQLHCGEAAYAAVNASITERVKHKLTLDNNVLAGPAEVELKGAKLAERGAPYFFFSFHTQQVNCLRDKNGEVVEGAVDDIRAVFYLMAVTRHPELDKVKAKLEYPWQISEIAIIGNQKTF